MTPTLLAPPPPPDLQPGPRPAFSVVMAAYQAQGTVEEAVRSALEQDEPPLEVVVVDDGSTDGTAEVLAKLAAEQPLVRVLRQPNGGEARARNAALAAARGTWAAVLDADDLFLPGRLRALADAVQARPDLSLFTTDAVAELDGVRGRRVYVPPYDFPVEDQLAALLEDNRVLGLVAVDRARLLAVGGYDEQVSVTTDWAAWLRLLASGAVMGCLTEPLAVYRMTAGSLSADDVRLRRGRVSTLERSAALPLGARHRALLEHSLARHRRELALAQARQALLERSPGRRRLSLAAARDRGQPVRTRIKSAYAALAPRIAARRLATPEAEAARAAALRSL